MGTMRSTPSPEMARLTKGMEDMDGLSVKVGWFPSAKYADGTPVAYVASIQEFGSGPIPPRPSMRPTIEEQSNAWSDLMAAAARGIATGKRTAADCMELLGGQAAGDTRAKIASITEPPLSLLTLQARKHRKDGGKVTGKTLGELAGAGRKAGPPDVTGVSTKPLVDTRIMLPTLTHVVSKGDAE